VTDPTTTDPARAHWAVRVSAILLVVAGLGAIAFGAMVSLIVERMGPGFMAGVAAWIAAPVGLGAIGIATGVMVWRRSAAWRIVGMILAALGVCLGMAWVVDEDGPTATFLLLAPPAFVLTALAVTGSAFRHRSDGPAHAGPGRRPRAIPGGVA
jgi:hypothetical protein